ncbi:MAG TPA: Kdo hydroxylase family protein, partial [Terrimicrobiaceae bacterium]|nr:Kdo hydroxylase family protein [Terrimicrobiaceae bacterium]
MNSIEILDLGRGLASISADLQDRAADSLESGKVLFLPHYGFQVTDAERNLLSPGVVNKSKNVSYDPRTGAVGGTALAGSDADLLRDMIARYSNFAQDLLLTLIPRYKDGTIRARTSFRPVEIEGRVTSWRKDDTRLHVDSFPSAPTSGKRILRVFANVNPEGRSRVWRLGEPFEQMARRFLPSIKRPLPGSA